MRGPIDELTLRSIADAIPSVRADVKLLNGGLELLIGMKPNSDKQWIDLSVDPGRWLWLQWQVQGRQGMAEFDLNFEADATIAEELVWSFGQRRIILQFFPKSPDRWSLWLDRELLWPPHPRRGVQTPDSYFVELMGGIA